MALARSRAALVASPEMNAASGSQPARGVMVGALKEVHPDRIVIGESILFLRSGMRCSHPPGTRLQVIYTEQNGRREVDEISPMRQ